MNDTNSTGTAVKRMFGKKLAGFGLVAIAVAACSGVGADRSPTGGDLATGSAQPRGRVLLGEFIGKYDATTGQMTFEPAYERRDDLGLAGQSAWVSKSGMIQIQTTGAEYVDTSGNNNTSGVPVVCKVSTAKNCGASSNQTCNAATCAQVQIKSATAAAFTGVDVEVSAIVTAKVEGDDSASVTTGPGSEGAAGINAAKLGVWRWTTTIDNSAFVNGPTIWQFDTPAIKQNFTFAIRAWGDSASANVNLAFATNPLSTFTTQLDGTTSQTINDTLTATGTVSTGALTGPTVTGSTAFSLATNTCTGATLNPSVPASASCTVGVKFACLAGQTGLQSTNFHFQDPVSGAAATLSASGTCNSSLSFSIATDVIATTPTNSATNGSVDVLKNNAVATTAALSLKSTTGSAAITIITDQCTGKTLAHNATCNITPRLKCTSAFVGTQTTVFTYGDGANSAQFTATGVCDPLSIASGTANFGTQLINVTATGGQQTVKNNALTSTGALKSNQASGSTSFDLGTADNCTGTTLGALVTCTLSPSVTCQSTDYGAIASVWGFTDPTSAQSVALNMAALCSPFNFKTDTPSTMTITGVGSTTRVIDVFNISTTNTGVIAAPVLTGTAASEAQISFDSGCQGALASNTFCKITATLTCPVVSVNTSYQVQATYTDPGSTATFSITAKGLCKP